MQIFFDCSTSNSSSKSFFIIVLVLTGWTCEARGHVHSPGCSSCDQCTVFDSIEPLWLVRIVFLRWTTLSSHLTLLFFLTSLSFQSCPLSIIYLRLMSLIEKERKTNSYRVTLLIRAEFEFPLLVSSALIKRRVLMAPGEMRWKLTLSASWFTSRSFSEGGSAVWDKHWTWQGWAVMVILKEYVSPEC